VASSTIPPPPPHATSCQRRAGVLETRTNDVMQAINKSKEGHEGNDGEGEGESESDDEGEEGKGKGDEEKGEGEGEEEKGEGEGEEEKDEGESDEEDEEGYESLMKLRLVLQTGICQKKFSVTDFIMCLFFPRSVSTVQPLQKLLTLLTVGLKISRDVDFEYKRKFFIRLSELPVTYSNFNTIHYKVLLIVSL
jgi:hypothetical protein